MSSSQFLRFAIIFFSISSILSQKPDSTSIITCGAANVDPLVVVVGHNAFPGGCHVTCKRKGQPCQAEFKDFGIHLGGNQSLGTINPPDGKATKFDFIVWSGDVSGQFAITSDADTSPVNYTVVESTCDKTSTLKCDRSQINTGENVRCTFVSKIKNKLVWIKTDTLSISSSPALDIKFSALDPPIVGKHFTFTVYTKIESNKVTIVDGHSTGYPLTIIGTPDKTTTFTCADGGEVPATTGSELECYIKPNYKGNQIYTNASRFTLKGGPLGSSWTAITGVDNTFSPKFVVGSQSKTGYFTADDGVGNQASLKIWTVPLGTLLDCDEKNIAWGASTKCIITPLEGQGNTVYSKSEIYVLKGEDPQTGKSIGKCINLQPRTVSNNFTFTYVPGKGTKTQAITMSDGYTTDTPPSIIISPPGNPNEKSTLTCSNKTLNIGETINCTIVAFDDATNIWAENTSFSLNDLNNYGIFSSVEPAVGKVLSVNFTGQIGGDTTIHMNASGFNCKGFKVHILGASPTPSPTISPSGNKHIVEIIAGCVGGAVLLGAVILCLVRAKRNQEPQEALLNSQIEDSH